jgi:hypothetical protein
VFVISTSFGLQRFGELAGDEIGVDVVRDAVGADADGAPRDEIASRGADQLGVDALDLPMRPMSTLVRSARFYSIFRAWMNAPSWPVSRPPCRHAG